MTHKEAMARLNILIPARVETILTRICKKHKTSKGNILSEAFIKVFRDPLEVAREEAQAANRVFQEKLRRVSELEERQGAKK